MDNETKTITVEGKVRTFNLGKVEIQTINDNMTDEEYDALKYMLSLDTSGVASLIEQVVYFQSINNDDSYKEALIEEIKFNLL